MAKGTCKPQSYIPLIRTQVGAWTSSDIDQVNIFALHLANTFQPNYIISTLPLEITTPTNPQIRLIALKEIKIVIKKQLNPRKTPGGDLIIVQVLQELPCKVIVMLTYLFTAAVRLAHVSPD